MVYFASLMHSTAFIKKEGTLLWKFIVIIP